MQLKSKREKPITGAPAAEVKISLFVMDLIKEQIFSPLHLPQIKTIQLIYAVVKKQAINRSAMAATTNKT
jgi:hypothetical protein